MISPAALNTRLKELQAAGFVHRVEAGYASTELGMRLYVHLCPLGDFGKDWAKHLNAENSDGFEPKPTGLITP